MMTNHELTDTKAQLAATLQQTANFIAILILRDVEFGPNTYTINADSDIRSIHLDSMAAIFKCGNQACPVTIKMTE